MTMSVASTQFSIYGGDGTHRMPTWLCNSPTPIMFIILLNHIYLFNYIMLLIFHIHLAHLISRLEKMLFLATLSNLSFNIINILGE